MAKPVRMRPTGVSKPHVARSAGAAETAAISSQRRAPKNSSGSMLKVAGAILFLLLSLIAGYLTYDNLTSGRREFQARHDKLTFTRDALTNQTDHVPIDELFSPENEQRYLAGDGVTVVFRTINDPRKNYETTQEPCTLEPWNTYFETTNPERRALVAAKKLEIIACADQFRKPLPIVRTIEVGVDDTEGVKPEFREFILRGLVGLDDTLTSDKDTTRIVFFRLSDADFRNYRAWNIEPGTSAERAKKAWDDNLQWLLEDRGEKRNSSIATGLFNILSRNQDIRSRRILIFSDGMENSPTTASFYQALRDPRFLDPANYATLDESISKVQPFPNLKFATVTWEMPPLPGQHFHAVRQYWQHVLRERCGSTTAAVNY